MSVAARGQSGEGSGGTERFGDYELVRYLAAGGMADLYLARSPRFAGRDLVLKRIQKRYLDHEGVVHMFLDEGRIAQLLHHQNIARVLDVGTVENSDYIVMEYVHGHDLIAIARRSAETGVSLPRAVVVGIIVQLAAGLDYAHTRRDSDGNPLHIVHCDISPGNVVVAFSGVTKIVDFGIARATIAAREQEGVAGKYQYMAPEQIKGLPLDSRADLFPLGTILWELTVGKRLFRGAPELVMRKVLDERIPWPTELVPGYPERLEEIVMRLLARKREERYLSAGEAAADLAEYLVRQEQDFAPSDIARFLGGLFHAAPVTKRSVADTDSDDLVRGMPEVESSDLVENEASAGAAPSRERLLFRSGAAPVAPTATARGARVEESKSGADWPGPPESARANGALVFAVVAVIAAAAVIAWLALGG